MVLSAFDRAMSEAHATIDRLLREAGFHKDPVGVKFTLMGARKDSSGKEERTIARGKVTGYSIDRTDRTEYSDALSLETSIEFIFDRELIYLHPKDPANHVWLACYKESVDDGEGGEEDTFEFAEVFVKFELF